MVEDIDRLKTGVRELLQQGGVDLGNLMKPITPSKCVKTNKDNR